MKKIIILLSMSLCLNAAVVAQEPEEIDEELGQTLEEEYIDEDVEEEEEVIQSPKTANHKYLPKAGDFALGVDASPFLTYLGSIFSDNGATAPTFGSQNIYGKYFLRDNQAIRVKLLLDLYNTSYKESVRNDAAYTTTPDATTIDTRKENVTHVELLAGYEFRRGRGRVQGFWGGEVGFGIGKIDSTYTYGNPMTVANQAPSTGFGLGNPTTRRLESKGGLNFSFSVGGFAGVEYFIAKQVALGGEVSLHFRTSLREQDEVTTQKVENNTVQEFATRSRSAADVANEFSVKTVAGGNIFLIFYF
jgi:hypothetical protein